MAAPNSAEASSDSAHIMAGFAKLQGEKSEYYMRTYSITLGHSSEANKVDFDLSQLDEDKGPHVSHLHARIFYDFDHHHFALEVFGENGCIIQKVSDIDENGCRIKVSYLPGSDPVKLNSQDLIEIDGKQFYFLLPKCSIFDTHAARDTELDISNSYRFNDGPARTQGESENAKNDTKNLGLLRREDKDTEEDQQLLEEEKNVVSSLVTLISQLCSPGDWVSMAKLRSKIFERFGKNWPSAKIRRCLPQEDGSGSSTETEGKPWRSLFPLLRKYPKHFVMTTVTGGEVSVEYVGLVSLVSLKNEHEP